MKIVRSLPVKLFRFGFFFSNRRNYLIIFSKAFIVFAEMYNNCSVVLPNPLCGVHVGDKTRRYNSRYSAEFPIIAINIIHILIQKCAQGLKTFDLERDADQWYFPEVMSEARDYPKLADRGGVFR